MTLKNLFSESSGGLLPKEGMIPSFLQEGTKEISNKDDLPNIPCFENVAPNDAEKTRLIAKVIKKTPELSPENWEKLTPEQRLNTLQGIENKIAKITERPPCKVVSEEMNNCTRGYYNDGKIAINSKLLESGGAEAMLQATKTMVHEGRHAYQFYNLKCNEVEPNQELIAAWRVNIEELGYETGEPTWPFGSEEIGFKKYFTQPVEVDARVFSENVVQASGLKEKLA